MSSILLQELIMLINGEEMVPSIIIVLQVRLLRPFQYGMMAHFSFKTSRRIIGYLLLAKFRRLKRFLRNALRL